MKKIICAIIGAIGSCAIAGCGAAADGDMESIGESQQSLTGGYVYGGSFLADDCDANDVPNPYTNALTCPSGYSARQSSRQLDPESGCGGVEYWCSQRAGSGFWFSGFNGFYQIHDGCCGSSDDVKNPLTNALSCPSGSTAYRISRVFAPEDHAGATQYVCLGGINGVSFGGTYQVDDCGHANIYNPLSGGALGCLAGQSPHKIGRIKTPESPRCGATQYLCY